MPLSDDEKEEIRAAAAAIRRDRQFRREDVAEAMKGFLDPKPVPDDENAPPPPPPVKEGEKPEDEKPEETPEETPPEEKRGWWKNYA